MPKEKYFRNKKCRYHIASGVWVSEDGTTLAYVVKDKRGGILQLYPDQIRHPRQIKDAEGNMYYRNRFGYVFYTASVVAECWCRPKPNDGKRYSLNHKDGNLGNNSKENLEWIPYHYQHTKEKYKHIQYKDLNVTVCSDGTIKIGKEIIPVCDFHYDADTDRNFCYGPKVNLPTKDHSWYGEDVSVNKLMKHAGYIQGDDADMISPVILHKDMDWKNFSSDNLEFVEASDPRYLNYQEIVKENRKQRTIELNPGKQLPSNWL